MGRPVAIGLGRATERHAAPPKVAAGAPVVPCRWSQDGPRRRGPESRSELRDRLVALSEGGGDTVDTNAACKAAARNIVYENHMTRVSVKGDTHYMLGSKAWDPTLPRLA